MSLILWGFAGWSVLREMEFAPKRVHTTMAHVDALRSYVGNRSASYTAYFHYFESNAVIYTSDKLEIETWKALRLGDQIPIKYRILSPGDCEVNLPAENGRRGTVPKVLGGAAALFTAALVVYFAQFWKKPNSRPRGPVRKRNQTA